MNAKIVLLALAIGSQAACSSPPDEPQSRARSGSSVDSDALAGYQHTFDKSHFAIGDSTTPVTEFGIYKVVGPWGVFGTHANTGKVLASPNGDSPSLSGKRILDAVVHNNAVKSYFVGAGLPADQILEVKAMPSMVSNGVEGDYGDEAPPSVLESYFSRISRQWQGIRIWESEAWAQMNVSGEVVGESVYWPELPSATLTAAGAFAANLADAEWKAAFLAKLPKTEGGTLVIHHTPAVWNNSFSSTVSYDVPSGNRYLHFNDQGKAFTLPDEEPGAWGDAPSMSK
jgi:hypothetical protein